MYDTLLHISPPLPPLLVCIFNISHISSIISFALKTFLVRVSISFIADHIELTLCVS